MRQVWKVKPVDEGCVQSLVRELSVSPLMAQVLFHRGGRTATQAHDFLCADLSSLAPPEQMTDLGKAVGLIRRAVRAKKKIMLVGDYDVDGLTGTALLDRVIRQMGGQVQIHIPNRISEGYGLKAEVIRRAADARVGLIVCVDCGTTSFQELALAAQLGLATVVVDHHELDKATRPPATAFLNPLQPGCLYPGKELASVGVAFALARGLLEGHPSLWTHLDLVALGTVADMAPLTGENRILVKAGLHALSGTQKEGLRALIRHKKLEGLRLESEDIGFSLAPLINAMGRVGSAEVSLRLLITEDAGEAQGLAAQMGRENKNRVLLQREAFKRALAKVTREVNFSRDRVIVLEDEKWHLGVAGIVAARLARQFHRPAVVIAMNGNLCRGSARSIQAFHLMEALETVKEHLVAFGGHPAAAGLTIARDRIPAFREALNQVAHERMDAAALTPAVELEGELPLALLTDQLLRDLEQLAPFGMGNPRPVFVSEEASLVEMDRSSRFDPWGIRVVVESRCGRSFEAIQPREALVGGWNIRKVRGPVKLAYSPVRSRASKIELKLSDLKPLA